MPKNTKTDKIPPEALWRRIRELEAQVAQLKLGQLDIPGLGADIIPELTAICKRRTGYWRFGVAENDQFWTRWKWTQGHLAGRYSITGHDDLVSAFWSGISRYDDALSGKWLPPLDTPPRRR